MILITFGITLNAQEKKELPIYTIAVNIIPESFDFPLVGFVNLANGSHNSAHMGFVNWNQNSFSGCQLSFVNTIGRNLTGTQIGFVNTAIDSVRGLQVGFVNTAFQKTDGAQIGFVNTTKTLNGFQLGFVNISDTIQKGVPFGFLSIVKNGGFRAIDVSVTEMFPLNISYKIGVKKLYSSFIASYNPNINEHWALGMGIGSILPLNKSFYLNPELLTQNQVITNEDNLLFSCALNVGYSISSKIHISIGSSLVWNNVEQNKNLYKEFLSLKKWEINEHNNLLLGARIGIKYVFTDF